MRHIKKSNKLRKEEKEKKAISNIVATVLLILIVIIAISIIWAAVIPAIKNSLELNNACTNARLSIDTQSGYTCYDASCSKANVVIARGSDVSELAGMLLGLESGAKTVSYIIKEDQSVVLSLNFDENSGTNVTDSSGKNNNGVASGSKWVNGKYGSALEFDSMNDSVSVPESESLEIEDSVTIEAWIKIDSVGAAQRLIL